MMQQPALQLHDIHLPQAASWWPPAIGWWILAIIVLAIVILVLVTTWKWLKFQIWRNKLLNEFNAELSASIADPCNQVIAITEALRQSALTLFPDNTVANLTGYDWLEFLEQQALNTPFTQFPGNLLIEVPYSNSVECDDNSVKQLKQMATNWVKHNATHQHYWQHYRQHYQKPGATGAS